METSIMAEKALITRRFALLGALASSAALAVPAVAAMAKVAPEKPVDLQVWLDAAPVDDVIQYHADRMAAALCKKKPGIWRFNTAMIENSGLVLFIHTKHPTFSGVQQDYMDYSRKAKSGEL
jgi:hypothetical protein